MTALLSGAALVRAYHRGEVEASDDELDRALGIPPQRGSYDPASDTQLHAQHPGESVVNLATPYPICRDVVDQLQLTPADVVVDMGCAAGRVVLYGGLTSAAAFIGIELVSARAALARAAASERVTIVHGNVLDHDFAVGSVFYAFRPFSVETEAAVVERLHDQARRRRITVVTYRLQPSLFDPTLFLRSGPSALQILRSAPQG